MCKSHGVFAGVCNSVGIQMPATLEAVLCLAGAPLGVNDACF